MENSSSTNPDTFQTEAQSTQEVDQVTDTSEQPSSVIEQVEIKSDCPQTEESQSNESNWKEGGGDGYYVREGREPQNDEGYEGDMEGDGGLMPPPSTVPV